ncbi:MAG: carbohydrate-binding family 9-like protein [Cellulosilyticaceae bacterium]
MYLVKTIRSHEDDFNAGILEVNQYAWGCECRPKTYARLVYVENKGFELKMWCYESNPRAIYHNPNDKVHTDSCMEAFINFYPEMEDKGYVSYEMNANGASHHSFGTGRGTRDYVLNLGFAHPTVEITKCVIDGEEVWEAKTFITLEHIKELYGKAEFKKGDKLRANFYKCGDDTEIPHYGSWHPVSAPAPDFHRPECFGELIID